MMAGSNESMEPGVQGVEKVNTMLDDGSGELKETKVPNISIFYLSNRVLKKS